MKISISCAKTTNNSIKKKSNVLASTFYYSVSGNDPGQWTIDYDGFFDVIDEAIADLGLRIESADVNTSIGGKDIDYYLSNGSNFNTYALECDVLDALYKHEIDDYDQQEFIKDWISQRCC